MPSQQLMMSISPMVVRWLLICGMLLLANCSGQSEVTKIALLAPFEGRLREIGYDAYYAAQLAFVDEAPDNIILLTVDDGGSESSAIERAQAFQQDPTIDMVILVGPFATLGSVQMHLGSIRTLIIGDWYSQPITTTVYQLSNPNIRTLTEPIDDFAQLDSNINWEGSEILALHQVPLMYPQRGAWLVFSSGALPDETFATRYRALGEFTPNPNILASLVYDGFRMSIQAIEHQIDIGEMNYTGINGNIQFANGYWINAPIYQYEYVNNRLQKSN